jgi:hypothetical protein
MAQTVVDLEQYFQRDIIEFLDKKKELQSKEKKSSSEMLSALEANNVSLAAKILEETITAYNKMTLSNLYKEQSFKKLLDMYRQASEFVRLNPQQCRLKDDVDLLANSKELEQGVIEKITAFENKMNEIEEMKINALEQRKQYASKLEQEIKLKNEAIALNIRKRDIVNAIKSYKELKSLFEQYPSVDIEKKQGIYTDLISFFMQINKLRKELEEDKIKILDDNRRIENASRNNINNYLRLADLKQLIGEIKEDVKISNFSAATQKTIEIREIINKIPEQYKHIRGILNSKVDIIVQRIEFVKRLKNHN